ncbi:MAG: hypothetical protein JWO18_1155 [Microbacteriaceae bacterium]|jgi:uridine kinase|nr:hypothetical protein [Microbacteriaceae bacterium]
MAVDSEDSFVRALECVCTAQPPDGMTTTIIAIDGFGGAGKSTLAAAIAERVTADIVHTDDFSSWDVPLDWWPRLRDQVLIPLSRNQGARYQRYDWGTRALAEWIELAPGGLVLIEGVSSSRVAFRPFLSRSIWVDAPRETRLSRGLERDGVGAREQWRRWMADEDAWASEESPADHADCTVSGTE